VIGTCVKLFWSAKVPPKVKIFTWKLATNTIAVQANFSLNFQTFCQLAIFVGCRRRPGIMIL
jgi:hypothetical protein